MVARSVTDADPLLDVRDLCVAFAEADGTIVHAANEVSFDVFPGAVLGIVGESGSGKSVTLRALLGIEAPGKVLSGQALFKGADLFGEGKGRLDELRGSDIGMIFQDPGNALSPMLSVGSQLTEVLRVKAKFSRGDAEKEAIALLENVGIPSAAERLRSYPHQLSGGMKQRVMIAMALAPRPALLLADEPTTALDVTVQDQVLALLARVRREAGMAMILVSHDLGVIAQEADFIAVMYAGSVVEYGSVSEVLDHPLHPYTKALMESTLPSRPANTHARIPSIEGAPPALSELADGCPFVPRCRYAEEECRGAPMVLDKPIPQHGSACVRADRISRAKDA